MRVTFYRHMAGKRERTHPDATIEALGAERHGVVTRRGLRAAGLSPDQIDDRLGRGTLVAVHRGVFALGRRGLSDQGRWLAAVLASGDGAALSHRSAGRAWGLIATEGSESDVTVAARRRRRRGIRLHQAPIAPEERLFRDGIPVTTSARTLLDLAQVLDARGLERALDEALYLGRAAPPDLAGTLARNRHRPGAAALRRALEGHDLGSTRTESALEERLVLLCDLNGLPRPLCQQRVATYRIDFLWPDARVIVESDGARAHRGDRRRTADVRRDRRLTDLDYRVVRISYEQATYEPERTVTRLRESGVG